MITRYLLCLTALGLFFSNSAPAADANTNLFSPLSLEVAKKMVVMDDQQKLGPGDKVMYRVLEDQEDPKSLTITDSGDLDVPYLGLVHASGKTSQQLAKEIKTRLQQQLYYRATVIMAVELINKTRVLGKVYVSGNVRNCGGYDIPSGDTFTVSKAILSAGGFSDFADKKHVKLIRKAGNEEQIYTLNIQEIWAKGDLSQDIAVQPGDTVVVTARAVNW